jgi:uncharacterized phage-like protein YoqJ
MGHSPQRFKFKYNEEAPQCKKLVSAITEEIKRLYAIGVRFFYVGCAVGVDTWAAEIVLDLKKQSEFVDVELFCAIPFSNHAINFTGRQLKRHNDILRQCTFKEVINRHYSPVAYKRLNYFMIDRSQHLVAIYDQNKGERSGLVQAVNYAIKKNLRITYIHPDTAEASVL